MGKSVVVEVVGWSRRVEASRGAKSTSVCDGAVVVPLATTRPLELGGNGGGGRGDEGGAEDDCILSHIAPRRASRKDSERLDPSSGRPMAARACASCRSR